MRYTKQTVIILIFFLFGSTGVAGLIGIGKTCVFSSVKAHVTKNGKPLKNADVIRRWEWNKLKEDKTVTDENGDFSFPAVFEYSILRFLPIEIVIGQALYIMDEGKEHKIWSASKRDPEENSEYGDRNINISCELTHKNKILEEYGMSKIVTGCRKNNES